MLKMGLNPLYLSKKVLLISGNVLILNTCVFRTKEPVVLNFGDLGLPEGFYFVNMAANGQTSTTKIVHNK
jgi:hypothetical protein